MKSLLQAQLVHTKLQFVVKLNSLLINPRMLGMMMMETLTQH